MHIAFQGGDVRAELVGSALYFKARDLLALLGLVVPHKEGSSASSIFYKIEKNTNVRFKTNIFGKSYIRSAKYILLSDVTTFLDNIHAQTKPATIQLMLEILKQFKTG